ncbi:hypothetical protein A6A03_09585 [Chloroflexus islandicus]|uniref:Uncharacterized protein n=1 Tax=Chloroflexus islandicus TaxID=1707952 RepID=A0A178MHT8_9CHLR|nr:hypothetical protein A6A03_09585 [Chloroflexus islandicus]
MVFTAGGAEDAERKGGKERGPLARQETPDGSFTAGVAEDAERKGARSAGRSPAKRPRMEVLPPGSPRTRRGRGQGARAARLPRDPGWKFYRRGRRGRGGRLVLPVRWRCFSGPNMVFEFVIAQAALPLTLQGRTEPMSADAVDGFELSRFTLTPSPSPVTRERGGQRRALRHHTAINGLLD